jgi:hypothetical protein
MSKSHLHGDDDGQSSEKPAFLSFLTGKWMDIPEANQVRPIRLSHYVIGIVSVCVSCDFIKCICKLVYIIKHIAVEILLYTTITTNLVLANLV